MQQQQQSLSQTTSTAGITTSVSWPVIPSRQQSHPPLPEQQQQQRSSFHQSLSFGSEDVIQTSVKRFSFKQQMNPLSIASGTTNEVQGTVTGISNDLPLTTNSNPVSSIAASSVSTTPTSTVSLSPLFITTPTPNSSSSSTPSPSIFLHNPFSGMSVSASITNNKLPSQDTVAKSHSESLLQEDSTSLDPPQVMPPSQVEQLSCPTSTHIDKKNVNRKEKSLGTLTDKFILLYRQKEENMVDKSASVEIKLDEIAKEMNVEKRRVYDIVNVLESLEVVHKRAVSLYQWIGFSDLRASLISLRIKGFSDPHLYTSIEELKDNKSEEVKQVKQCLSHFPTDIVLKRDEEPSTSEWRRKREKSLALLSQKFIQLFLVTQMSTITHDTVVEIVIKKYNGISSDSGLRTKVRRLYDIVNILTSLNLIQKISSPENKKQAAFKWIGEDLGSFIAKACEPSTINNLNKVDKNKDESQPFVSPSKSMPLKKRKRMISKPPPQPVPTQSKAGNNKSPTRSSRIKNHISIHNDDPADTPDVTIDHTNASNNIETAGGIDHELHDKENTQTDHNGLHFQFHSPPPKRNKQSTDSVSTKYRAPPVIITKPLTPRVFNSVDSQPLSNTMTRILNHSTGTTKLTLFNSDPLTPKQPNTHQTAYPLPLSALPNLFHQANTDPSRILPNNSSVITTSSNLTITPVKPSALTFHSENCITPSVTLIQRQNHVVAPVTSYSSPFSSLQFSFTQLQPPRSDVSNNDHASE